MERFYKVGFHQISKMHKMCYINSIHNSKYYFGSTSSMKGRAKKKIEGKLQKQKEMNDMNKKSGNDGLTAQERMERDKQRIQEKQRAFEAKQKELNDKNSKK